MLAKSHKMVLLSSGQPKAFNALEFDPFRSSLTQPMASPVNASCLPSRAAAQHMGPKPLARHCFVEDFTSYPLPACPGAPGLGSRPPSSPPAHQRQLTPTAPDATASKGERATGAIAEYARPDESSRALSLVSVGQLLRPCEGRLG